MTEEDTKSLPVVDDSQANIAGLAVDAWVAVLPVNPYDPCPCGCGVKWKWARTDPAQHEQRFVTQWMTRNSSIPGKAEENV
jgi:hypothetical protein